MRYKNTERKEGHQNSRGPRCSSGAWSAAEVGPALQEGRPSRVPSRARREVGRPYARSR